MPPQFSTHWEFTEAAWCRTWCTIITIVIVIIIMIVRLFIHSYVYDTTHEWKHQGYGTNICIFYLIMRTQVYLIRNYTSHNTHTKTTSKARVADFPYGDQWGIRWRHFRLCTFNRFTPKSDQYQISPAALLEILRHRVWRTWLFIAYSDEEWFYYQFSLPHL